MEKISEKLLLRIPEVAELLSISRSTAYTMAAAGELPVVRIRGGLRVPAARLMQMIEEQTLSGPDNESAR
jgi:excisionase family DNA binding protein